MSRQCGSLVSACLLIAVTPAFASKPSFRPDITMNCTNLDGWHPFGQAEWRAEKGEAVGRPNQAQGGCLVLDHSYQDVNFCTGFRCTEGCVTMHPPKQRT